jgi:acyl-CoA synthetase (AMP-forming)/AMP-acid ligase II
VAETGVSLPTGDIGYVDSDGYLFIVDRMKDMIKSGGYNVYSREVEDALYAHPDVLEAAVIGLPDPRWIEAVHAVVTLRLGCSVDEADLITHVRERLAGYKVPKEFHVVDSLPRTGVNKIDKIALKRKYGAWCRRRCTLARYLNNRAR